jgi:uracil-DNA glycosylase family 4
MDALAMLRLQIEWGADEALEDAPVDRLHGPQTDRGRSEQPEAGPEQGRRLPLPLREGIGGRGSGGTHPSPQPPPARGGGVSALASPRGATAAEHATAVAGQARTIDELRAALAAFDGCALRDTAATLVFAAGDPSADLMLIGEPPGEAEDRSGTPVAGADGVLLDRMLASAGLTRDGLLLTPLIPWRPPGGRPPNPSEIAICLPFLHRLIALAAPRRIVLAGMLTAKSLLGATRRRAGQAWIEMTVPGVSAPIPALVMPSPALVARTPNARRDAWAALRLLRRTLDADLAKT